MSERYAIYFAPPAGTELDALASVWLGRHAWNNMSIFQPDIDGIERFTAEPRHYGFHATLKAPFHLAPGRDRSALERAVAELAQRLPPLTIAPLEVATLGDFLALVPEFESDELRSFAALCVKELDRFRAPLTQTEIERRLAGGLTQPQERLLRNWGYPFVLDEFRFHMTLTGKLASPERERIGKAAKRHFASCIGKPLIIDAMTIFCEPAEKAPFVAQSRFALNGVTETKWPEIWKFGAR